MVERDCLYLQDNFFLMKKTVLIFYLLCFCISLIPAQDQMAPPPLKKKGAFWSKDKLVFGGDMGLGFGTVTNINLSPTIGYKVTERYVVGLGPNYMYYNDNYYKVTFSIYGGNVFNRFYITDFLFAHLEYQALNAKWDYFIKDRFWVYYLWAGGGLSRSIGVISTHVLVLWNLTAGPNSYIPNPQIRGGIGIGF